jgi:hypothetical protein
MDERQPVFQCDLLCPLEFLETHRLQGTRFDARIVDEHDAMRAADEPDAGEQAAARDGLFGIRHVEQVPRASRQFQERGAGVEQQGKAFARQRLATLLEPGPRTVGGGGRAVAQCVVLRDQREQVRAVLRERLAGGVERRPEDRHGPSFAGRVAIVDQALA